MTHARRFHSNHSTSRRPVTHRVANSLLIAAVSASAVLAGCQSAIDREAADRGSARYSESLIARSVLQGTYHAEMMQDPTIAQGVRELPRVDSPGPAATTDTAVIPAGTPLTLSPPNAAPPTPSPPDA